ncbi:MAG: hypothetical protein WCJ61_11235 [Paludibacter sp.]
MKKTFTLIIFLCIIGIVNTANAQQVIVTDDAKYTTPASGAMLDVKSTSKGFMPPRVALTSLTDATTIVTPATGLMVYNTGTGALTDKGIYYWNGTSWTKALTGGNGSTNSMNIADDGTVTLSGSATTWNDLVINPSTARNEGNNTPEWALFVSPYIYTWKFSPSTVNEVDFSVQMPHNYKEGSTIYPHVHWSSTSAAGTNRVRWVLYYQWVNFGDNYVSNSSTFVYGTELATNDAISLTAYQHTITPMNPSGVVGTGIVGTDKKISSVLMCRLYRDGANAADNFSGNAFLLSVDFHYEIDSFGSRETFVK